MLEASTECRRGADVLALIPRPCDDHMVAEESKMRAFSVAFLALASLAQAHAQDKIKKPDSASACTYEISSGDTYTVSGGDALCCACLRLLTRNTRCYTATRRYSRSLSG
jgi:hypothetical protein